MAHTLFYIDFKDIPQSPLYFVFNYVEGENMVLCIFKFQEPSNIKWTQLSAMIFFCIMQCCT
jgi:hypothetical protein